MGGGVVIAVLWLATPDVEQLREQANDDLVEGPVRQGAPRAGTGAGADAARRARAARRRAGRVGRRTVRLRGRRARAGAPLREPHPRSRGALPARRGAVRPRAATKRRGASTTSPSSRSDKTPTAKMEKLWLARIYARRGYVVLADRLYESMQPRAARSRRGGLAQPGRRPSDQRGLGGRRQGARAATSRSSRRACAAARCSAGRSRRAATSTASWRCGAACRTTTRRPRTIATTGARSSAPTSFPRRATGTAARCRRTATNPDATLVTSYQRMRYRTTPEVAGGALAAVRSAGVGVARCRRARRCRSAPPQRRGVRLARPFVRLEREPGRRAERARRSAAPSPGWARTSVLGPAVGGVAAGRRRRALPTPAGTDADRRRAAVGPAAASSSAAQAEGAANLWSFAQVNMHA